MGGQQINCILIYRGIYVQIWYEMMLRVVILYVIPYFTFPWHVFSCWEVDVKCLFLVFFPPST